MKQNLILATILLLIFNSAHADLNQTLREAAEKGDIQTVTTMLKQGAQIDGKSSYGTTPLMAAAYAGRTDVVKLLVAKGASVNAVDNTGESALMTAASKGRHDVVVYLIAQGADVHQKNNKSQDALALAAGKAPRKNRPRIIQLLVDKGCDPNTKDKNNHTPLMDAAYNGDINTVRYLVEKGADVNTKDITGQTAKNYAEIFGFADQAEIVKYLKGKESK